MTVIDIRNEVLSKFHKGQVIKLNMKDGRNIYSKHVKIIGFYPNIVLTEHKGLKESYSYYEMLKMAAVEKAKQFIIPKRLARGAYKYA